LRLCSRAPRTWICLCMLRVGSGGLELSSVLTNWCVKVN